MIMSSCQHQCVHIWNLPLACDSASTSSCSHCPAHLSTLKTPHGHSPLPSQTHCSGLGPPSPLAGTDVVPNHFWTASSDAALDFHRSGSHKSITHDLFKQMSSLICSLLLDFEKHQLLYIMHTQCLRFCLCLTSPGSSFCSVLTMFYLGYLCMCS